MRPITRRDFVARSTSCAAHLALAAAAGPALLRELWASAPAGAVVAREPFGYLERVADGVWALISTPLDGDRTTLSNGGIVAGRSGVLAIEGFYHPDGALWLARKARELTGRWPTHVALTHYHADHVQGVAGYRSDEASPTLHGTEATRDAALGALAVPGASAAPRTPAAPAAAASPTAGAPPDPAVAALAAALGDVVPLPPTAPATIDLGGRSVRVVPRAGHTASDVTLELDDPAVVFCGDLVWNAMFPNYVDAAPTRLSASVRALPRASGSVYVPGHGALAREGELDRYLALLDEVEGAARQAHGRGLPAAEAAAGFTLPDSLGEWLLFNRAFFERAFTAWYRELGA